jgi:hypothetical protein
VSEDHLFGEPGDEALKDSIDEVVDRRLEWLYDEVQFPHTMTVEEFTAHPRRYHFRPADDVIEDLLEWTAENGEIDENFHDLMYSRAQDEDVTAAISLLASKVNYRMADEIVMLHTVVVTSPDLWQVTQSRKP